MVGAGTGSGKTYLAGLVCQMLLSRGEIDRVVYVSPNRLISERVRQTFAKFKIILSVWENSKHATPKKGDAGEGGESVATQGAIVTYPSLAQKKCWETHKRIAQRKRTLVIFDEIHHLGDKQKWATAAANAFQFDGVAILAMSGTPFRSDNRQIPFSFYEADQSDGSLRYLRCDYPYPLGRSVADGVCKRPMFHWLDGVLEMTIEGVRREYSKDSPPPEEYANTYLGGCVQHGSKCRRDALTMVVNRCRAEGRKLIIFLGGDSRANTRAVEDAERHLPAELLSLGELDVPLSPEDIVTVTSETQDAAGKIATFGSSKAFILITVHKISEGVDIPELSAALFLTHITATSTTIQRIGRALRGCLPQQALIFMFWHPRYVTLAEKIERQVTHELRLRDVRRAATDRAGPATGQPSVEVRGVATREGGVTINGRTYTQGQVAAAREHLASNSHPNTNAYLAVTLDILFPARRSA